jgi:glycosyltransferase involved in cell wall biosynthesis
MHGANRSLLGLIDGLKSYNVKSIVICPNKGPITEELERRNIKHYILPINYWMWKEKRGRVKRLLLNIISRFTIIPILIKEKIKIIYTNSSATPVGAFSAFLSRKPHVWHIREYGELDYNLHHDWGKTFFEYWIKKSSAIISISNSIKEIVLKNISTTKIHIIYNGIISKTDLDQIKEKLKTYNKKEDYTFIIIGQVNSNKNQGDAIKAFDLIRNKYPKTKLLIIGDCNNKYSKDLKKMCAGLELENRIVFYGFMRDPFKILSEADCSLMCSKNEGMGRVTAESMAYGKPVIGMNSTGTKEIIENNKTGLLYDGSYLELSELMEKCINNQEWTYNLGLNGIKKAEDSFLIEDYAKNVYNILKEL